MGWPGPGHAPQAALLGTSLMVFFSCIEAEQERVVTGHKINDREKANEVASCSSSCNGSCPGSGVLLPSIREPEKFHSCFTNSKTLALLPIPAGDSRLAVPALQRGHGGCRVFRSDGYCCKPLHQGRKDNLDGSLGVCLWKLGEEWWQEQGGGNGAQPFEFALQDESSQPFPEPSVRFPRTRG